MANAPPHPAPQPQLPRSYPYGPNVSVCPAQACTSALPSPVPPPHAALRCAMVGHMPSPWPPPSCDADDVCNGSTPCRRRRCCSAPARPDPQPARPSPQGPSSAPTRPPACPEQAWHAIAHAAAGPTLSPPRSPWPRLPSTASPPAASRVAPWTLLPPLPAWQSWAAPPHAVAVAAALASASDRCHLSTQRAKSRNPKSGHRHFTKSSCAWLTCHGMKSLSRDSPDVRTKSSTGGQSGPVRRHACSRDGRRSHGCSAVAAWVEPAGSPAPAPSPSSSSPFGGCGCRPRCSAVTACASSSLPLQESTRDVGCLAIGSVASRQAGVVAGSAARRAGMASWSAPPDWRCCLQVLRVLLQGRTTHRKPVDLHLQACCPPAGRLLPH